MTNNVVPGQGIIDWPGVFRAAKKAGVKWYFIEDESPASVEQIPLSLRYLEKVKFNRDAEDAESRVLCSQHQAPANKFFKCSANRIESVMIVNVGLEIPPDGNTDAPAT